MRRRYIILMVLVVIILVVVFLSSSLYQGIFGGNVMVKGKGHAYLIIPTGAGFEDVRSILSEGGWLKNERTFVWLAEKKNYPRHVHAGRYLISNGMSNNALINLLRSGRQEPVTVTFTSVRSLNQMAGTVGRQIEADSSDIIGLLTNRNFLSSRKITPETLPAYFIPNTYEFWWNTSAEEFFDRMMTEYKRFWNDTRDEKAEKQGLSRIDVSTLASIVDEETVFDDEKPAIAGVYLNRLRKDIPLQADPTIKFAIGDFTIRRVLTKQLQFNSPYNTYKNRGLPPGPIRIPSIAALESVLNAEKHDYYYFCAKDDFSGYHHFSRTLEQHNMYARKYRQALNRNRIME